MILGECVTVTSESKHNLKKVGRVSAGYLECEKGPPVTEFALFARRLNEKLIFLRIKVGATANFYLF